MNKILLSALMALVWFCSGANAVFASAEKDDPFTQLRPVNSGPGVLVCAPVAEQAALQDFAIGCGRWLMVQIGGQSEFGKTPSWLEIQQAQMQMKSQLKRPHLQLEEKEAALPARALGLTHVATATLYGPPDNLVLRYQWWEFPGRKALGAPVEARGDQQKIVEQLPELAQALCQRLGLKTPKISAVGVDVTELSRMGALRPDSLLLGNDLPPQVELAHRNSLMTVLMQSNGIETGEQKVLLEFHKQRFRDFLEHESENMIVFNILGAPTPEDNAKFAAHVDIMIPRFSANYNFINGLVRWCRISNNRREDEYSLAQTGVRCAPKNPFAWMDLAEAISGKAEDIRKGRFYEKMSEAEQKAVEQLYVQRLAITQRAIEVGPQNSAAWRMHATALTFGGDMESADRALRKALDLNPDESNAYFWATQLYAPKWMDDLDAMVEMAHRVAEDDKRLLTGDLHLQFIGTLRANGLFEEAARIQAKATEAALRLTQSHPDDWGDRLRLARLYEQNNEPQKAAEQLLEIIRRDPKNPSVLSELGMLLATKVVPVNAAEANKYLLRAVELQPDGGSLLFYHLGRLSYIYMGDDTKAEEYFSKAATFYQAGAEPYLFGQVFEYLGHLAERKDNFAKAEEFYRKAIASNPQEENYHAYLAAALLSQNKREEAVRAARRAMELGMEWSPVFDKLGLTAPAQETTKTKE